MANVDEDLNRFKRFLAIGSEDVYRVGVVTRTWPTSNHSADDVPSCLRKLLLAGRGEEVVREVIEFQSVPNIRSSPSLQALAICARSSCEKTKSAAFKAVNQVCKTPSQLFSFIQYAKNASETRKGWGRALRRTVSDWYNKKDAKHLAVLATRYKSSSGWTHRDVLRLSHTKPENPGVGVVVKYLLRGVSTAEEAVTDDTKDLLEYLQAVDTVKHSADDQEVAALISRHVLSKEHIPTKLLNSSEVWSALTEQMTVSELLTNIGKLASLNLLDAACVAHSVIISKIQDGESLIAERVPPLLVLIALRTYEQGKNKGKWTVHEDVVAALNKAFTITVSKNIVGSGKRVLVGVKISSNLHRTSVRGTAMLSPVTAVAGLVYLLLRTESSCQLVSFLSDVRPLSVTQRMTYPEVCKEVAKASIPLPPQLCQCDLTATIRWAEDKKQPFDVIVIMTDSKESSEDATLSRAIEKYRQTLKLQTRLVVCGLTASQVDEIDPNDTGSLGISGFDASVPDVISKFATGHI